MVEIDGGDDGETRLVDHIGGIEPAAKPDLEHQIIGGIAGKGEKAAAVVISEDDRLAGIGLLAFGQQGDEVGLGDERAAARPTYADPLVKLDEMRRGVDMSREARCLDDGAAIGDDRALAIGAGDMDDRRHAPLRVA